MTIIGIGVDIFNSNRIKLMNLKNKIKFANRILHPFEKSFFNKSVNISNFLSYKFVIKEATAKAFGIGIRNKLTFNQIEIIHNDYGKPILKFHNHANNLIKNLKITNVNVSLSHENNFSCAIVIMEKN